VHHKLSQWVRAELGDKPILVHSEVKNNAFRIFNTRFKKCRLLLSAVISEHFSKNYMIISVVAAKIWYLKNVRFYWATLYM